jgi:hypothetical protein
MVRGDGVQIPLADPVERSPRVCAYVDVSRLVDGAGADDLTLGNGPVEPDRRDPFGVVPPPARNECRRQQAAPRGRGEVGRGDVGEPDGSRMRLLEEAGEGVDAAVP